MSREHMNYFNRALRENKNIEEEFRTLIHDALDRIYFGMQQKDFLRWVEQRQISERIKQMVIKSFTEDEVQNMPNIYGYYTDTTNTITLNRRTTHTTSHETLHFFSDSTFRENSETFPRFMLEGITEYLNREFEKIESNDKEVVHSYKRNVGFAELLHSFVGDSLIKAYMQGTSKEFSEEFSSYITRDGIASETELTKFYELLDKIHMAYDPRIKNTKSESWIKSMNEHFTQNEYPAARQYMANIVSNSIRKKAHNLEYYEDGEFLIDTMLNDIKKITNETIDMLSKTEIFGMSADKNSAIAIELRENILKQSLTAVLQESHISNDKIEDMVNKAIRKTSITTIDEKTYRIPAGIKENVLMQEINDSDFDILQGLINKRLGNAENYTQNGYFSMTSFFMEAASILDIMELNPENRKRILEDSIENYLPKNMSHTLAKDMIYKHGKLYSALYQKQQANKQNIIDSKFVRISDTKFIEKRDSKIYYLEYDETTGAFTENEMTTDSTPYGSKISKDLINEFGGNAKQVSYIDRTTGHSQPYFLTFNEDFSKVMVNGKYYEPIDSLEKLGDTFLIDEAMKSVFDGIENNKYISIINDGNAPLSNVRYTGIVPDTRSRIIDSKLFMEELRSATHNLPKNLRANIEKKAISQLISENYFINPKDSPEIQNYINALLNDEKMTLQTISSYSQILNQFRRNYIEQESQYNAIHFKEENTQNNFQQTQVLSSNNRVYKTSKIGKQVDEWSNSLIDVGITSQLYQKDGRYYLLLNKQNNSVLNQDICITVDSDENLLKYLEELACNIGISMVENSGKLNVLTTSEKKVKISEKDIPMVDYEDIFVEKNGEKKGLLTGQVLKQKIKSLSDSLFGEKRIDKIPPFVTNAMFSKMNGKHKLTPENFEVIKYYKEEGYRFLNSFLGGDSLETTELTNEGLKGTIQKIYQLYELFDEFPTLDEDITIYRGDKKRESLEYNSFISASLEEDVAEDFSKGRIYQINLKKGNHYIPIDSIEGFEGIYQDSEAEILLRPSMLREISRETQANQERLVVGIQENENFSQILLQTLDRRKDELIRRKLCTQEEYNETVNYINEKIIQSAPKSNEENRLTFQEIGKGTAKVFEDNQSRASKVFEELEAGVKMQEELNKGETRGEE